jgi:hypothetical protein
MQQQVIHDEWRLTLPVLQPTTRLLQATTYELYELLHLLQATTYELLH